jgi:tetratricopeptide (TPR) repeat protein
MYYKGAILSALGKNEEALEALESALQMDNSLKEAKAGKGKALMALGNYKQALDFFRETLEDEPESPESFLPGMGREMHSVSLKNTRRP